MSADNIVPLRAYGTPELIAEQARTWALLFEAVAADGLDPLTLEPIEPVTELMIARAVNVARLCPRLVR